MTEDKSGEKCGFFVQLKVYEFNDNSEPIAATTPMTAMSAHRCLVHVFRLHLPDPYVGPDDVDFICSKTDDDGMTQCTDLPRRVQNGLQCNATYRPGLPVMLDDLFYDDDGSLSCVDWNRYYTVCKTGLSNPYRGAISFDNIGLAWVAIFQVSSSSGVFHHRVSYSTRRSLWSTCVCIVMRNYFILLHFIHCHFI